MQYIHQCQISPHLFILNYGWSFYLLCTGIIMLYNWRHKQDGWLWIQIPIWHGQFIMVAFIKMFECLDAFHKNFLLLFLNERLTFCVLIKYIYVISSRCFIGKHKMPFFPFKKWLGVSYRKDTFPRKKYVRCSFKYQISNVLIWSSFICKQIA